MAFVFCKSGFCAFNQLPHVLAVHEPEADIPIFR
jgi:hypothetical protein